MSLLKNSFKDSQSLYILEKLTFISATLYTRMSDHAEPTYLVCPTPSWSGHNPKNNVRMTSLEMMREVRAGRVVFEALGFGPVRPYADFEKRYPTMEEMHAARGLELKRCIAELIELNGPL